MSVNFDISNVVWTKTLWFNTTRCIFAGFSWLIFVNVLFYLGIGKDIGILAWVFLNPILTLIIIPLFYFMVLTPLGLMMSNIPLSSIIPIPFGKLLNIITFVVVFLGDPFVWLLNKIKPSWVPVRSPGILSKPLFFIIDKSSHRDAQRSSEIRNSGTKSLTQQSRPEDKSKKFVCRDCSTVEWKREDVKGMRCPNCGRSMSLVLDGNASH